LLNLKILKIMKKIWMIAVLACAALMIACGGEKKADNSATTTVVEVAAPAPAPAPAPVAEPEPKPAVIRKVGEIIEINGTDGVVFAITDGGAHGKVLSLAEYNEGYEGATYAAVTKWCSSLGKGWRMPTKNELLAIYKKSKKLRAAISWAEYEVPDLEGEYLSSTKVDATHRWRVDVQYGYSYHQADGSRILARAVCEF
jgi:hypothetical protein